ncbi:tetratricopeptide repeat protein [Xanthomonas maliensis]|uniref:tetratricopeptide repeat protein n=1 Tax=Xanthomonas maliensis TaxID=1321368 RepID=UPI00039D6BBD|nr:tetratricopeptide repeat protein [Xanthomonas maliensis]KAB7763625.1 cytochrome C biogenesis protein [Xanthomonas maliensis]
MAAFIAIAACLAVLAFGLALQPLWRQTRGVTAASMAVLLAGSAALYWQLGTPSALTAATTRAPPRSLDEAIAQLQEALARDPNQPEGWMLLGRSLSSRQQFAAARDAFARAAALQPDEPDVLVAAAQSRLVAAPTARDPETTRLLQHALALQPGHERARWFLGVVQRQAGQPAKAAETWMPLLATVAADTRPGLLEQINAARQDAGLAPLASADTAPTTAAAGQQITVHVRLDPAFASRRALPADTSVFVIARSADSPMPVAVEKHRLADLPLTVTLDDNDSPMPTRRLSSLQQVQVSARLSRSGTAQRQAEDVDTEPVTVQLPAKAPVELLIGR